MSFEKLNLIEPILSALKKEGYTTPTPIQEQAIPILLEGNDLLGCAQTGTGKTAAFAIPILQLLTQNPGHTGNKRAIRSLIVTPTRELAIQIGESFASYGRNLNLRHTVIFGGVNQFSQVNALKAGIDILICTPGRLLDLVQQRHVNLSHIQMFVLDEADRMLDMGFVNDVKRIIKLIPERRQSLFFSATMPKTIQELANSILTTPKKVEVTPVSSTAEKIEQAIYFVDQAKKNDLLVHVLQDKSIKSALVFTRTKHGADKVVKLLQKHSIKAEAIHGNKSQNHRQRALSNFKGGHTRVLVATDIAARGIDIDELAFVVNFEIPNIPETYVHRIGRTGRAGAEGKAISFCDIEERAYLRDIQKLIGLEIPVVNEHPFPAENKPAPGVAQKPQGKKPFSRSGGGKSHRGSGSGSSNGGGNRPKSGGGFKPRFSGNADSKKRSS
jgi:ATP-dependent RNA helicase RhlE